MGARGESLTEPQPQLTQLCSHAAFAGLHVELPRGLAMACSQRVRLHVSSCVGEWCVRGCWVEWHRADVDIGWNGTVQTWIFGGMAPYRRGFWVEWHRTDADVGWSGVWPCQLEAELMNSRWAMMAVTGITVTEVMGIGVRAPGAYTRPLFGST